MAKNDFSAATGAPNLSQYINLANYVYTSGKRPSTFPTQIGYAPLEYDGNVVSELDSATGFYGQAFISTDTSQPPSVIVAFEGTNLAHNPPNKLFQAAQVYDDYQIFKGQNAPSYQDALDFTQVAIQDAEAQDVAGNNIYLDGHSLGAAEAEYVATQTNLPGVTFGAPGISSANFNPHAKAKLTNYVEYGDPVGNYAANPPRALGPIVQSNSIKHYGKTIYVGPQAHRALLNNAASEYSSGVLGKAVAAGDFAYGFTHYHPLTNYASANDLGKIDPGLTLYNDDGSTGSDASFFAPLFSPLLASASVATADVACFASGTRIQTSRGRIAVEALSIEDRVITGSGERRPIRWIGHRTIDCRTHPRPQDVMPIRVAAHAFGLGKPERDLYLSPGHPVLVGAGEDGAGGYLVPILCLINGTTIERVAVDEVTYWHIELDEHDILLADGLPAESYIDLGSRPFFAGADCPLYDPDMARPGMPGRCRPVAVDGVVVEIERRRLDAAFALRLGSACAWPTAGDASQLL